MAQQEIHLRFILPYIHSLKFMCINLNNFVLRTKFNYLKFSTCDIMLILKSFSL